MTLRLRFAAAVLAYGAIGTSHAATLATQQLVTPLIPNAQSSATIGLPGLDPSKPVWVAYRVVGLSPTKRPTGAVHFHNSFEGVALPAGDMMWRMDARDMRDGDTTNLQTQLQALAAQRPAAQLQAALGSDMYAAYQAVLAGDAASVDGRTVRTLPAPGRNDAPLQVSVESAEGVQPVLVSITVGQGDVPAELGSTSSAAFRIGRVVAILALVVGLLVWWRRRD